MRHGLAPIATDVRLRLHDHVQRSSTEKTLAIAAALPIQFDDGRQRATPTPETDRSAPADHAPRPDQFSRHLHPSASAPSDLLDDLETHAQDPVASHDRKFRLHVRHSPDVSRQRHAVLRIHTERWLCLSTGILQSTDANETDGYVPTEIASM